MPVNASFTMTCDRCQRYLTQGSAAVNGATMVDVGEESMLLDAAVERGWLIGWSAGGPQEVVQTLCPWCAKKEED